MATTYTIGETALNANNGEYVQVGSPGQNVPVFQGAASGNYTLTSPVLGKLTSWAFRSGGAPTGTRFELAVLAPATGTEDNTNYRLLALSPPYAVRNAGGVDGFEGPIQIPDSSPITIDVGERIALIPVDDTNVPLEQGVNGVDGIRTFSQPFGGLGSSQAISPSSANNGVVLPVQATVDDGKHLVNNGAPYISSNTKPAKSGSKLTCHTGAWGWSGTGSISYAYSWFWDGQAPAAPPAIPPSLPVKFGKGSVSAFTGVPQSPLFGGGFRLAGTAQTLVVPTLDSPTRYYCVVTASAGGQQVDASSAKLLVPPRPPHLRQPSPFFGREVPPRITPGVGVGGKNICLPGSWTGNPRFTYTWKRVQHYGKHVTKLYTVSGPSSDPTYTVDPSVEGKALACLVTASNLSGEDSALSNEYKVPVSAPVAKSGPQVSFVLSRAVSGPSIGGVGTGNGVLDAQKIRLDCHQANWNRNDVTVTDEWVDVDHKGNPLSSVHENGSSIELDMTPGNMQYHIAVQCWETATTHNGARSVARSGWIAVWNGCDEEYTVDGKGPSGGSQPFIESPGHQSWLQASPPSSGFGGNYSVAPIVKGMFGLTGEDLVAKSDPSWSPHRAVTYGDNCLDYQHYLEDNGYDIKQWPTDPPNWLDG